MAVFDPNDEENKTHSESSIAIAMIVLVVLIIAVVFVVNGNNCSGKKSDSSSKQPLSEGQISTQDDILTELNINSTDKRTSDQLDIWNLDLGNKESDTQSETNEGTEMISSVPSHNNEILIRYYDQTSRYVPIDYKIPKNHYESSSFMYQRPIMKYFDNGNKASYLGVLISDSIKNTDFSTLSRNGVEFVMICAGHRDKISGKLIADSKLANNIKAAINNDLSVGIYFIGQADDIVYIREEANYLADVLSDYEITYPVAYVIEPAMDSVEDPDPTGKSLRTEYLLDFCAIMEDEEYLPMIAGDKETLVLKIDLNSISDAKIWLREYGDIPEYPYQFSIWSYSSAEQIDGIQGKSEMLIGMEDLTTRTATRDN